MEASLLSGVAHSSGLIIQYIYFYYIKFIFVKILVSVYWYYRVGCQYFLLGKKRHQTQKRKGNLQYYHLGGGKSLSTKILLGQLVRLHILMMR